MELFHHSSHAFGVQLKYYHLLLLGVCLFFMLKIPLQKLKFTQQRLKYPTMNFFECALGPLFACDYLIVLCSYSHA